MTPVMLVNASLSIRMSFGRLRPAQEQSTLGMSHIAEETESPL